MNPEQRFDPNEAESVLGQNNADVEAQHNAKLKAERVAAMTARVDAAMAEPEEKDEAPKVDTVEGANLTPDETATVAEEKVARTETVLGHEDEFLKELTGGEKKFFAEGAELDATTEQSAISHARAAVQMGYKETPKGDLVRGNAVSQELGELGRAAADLTERITSAKEINTTKGWLGRMMGRREVARLEAELEKKTEELERARTRVAAPELADAAAKARAERKG